MTAEEVILQFKFQSQQIPNQNDLADKILIYYEFKVKEQEIKHMKEKEELRSKYEEQMKDLKKEFEVEREKTLLVHANEIKHLKEKEELRSKFDEDQIEKLKKELDKKVNQIISLSFCVF